MANNTPGVDAPNPYPSGTEPGNAGTKAAEGGASQSDIGKAAAGEAQSQSQVPAGADPTKPATAGGSDPLGIGGLSALLTTLTSANFWKRAGLFAGGALLIWWGVLAILAGDPTVRAAATTAVKAAV